MSLYIPWAKKWFGSYYGLEYREGRTVLTVRPDMDGVHWYWSVNWPKQQMPPHKNEDGSQWVGGELKPRVTKAGKVATEEEAKAAALEAFGKGRENP